MAGSACVATGEDWPLKVKEGPRSEDDLLLSRMLRELDSLSNMPNQHSLKSAALSSVSIAFIKSMPAFRIILFLIYDN